MFNYHGVPKDQVIRSVQQMADFILSLHLGPHNDQWAKEFVAGATGSATLDAAQTDIDFHNALKPFTSEISRRFELLKTHAILNTNGTADALYREACRWRPFGATHMALTALDKEEDAHLKPLTRLTNPSYALAFAKYAGRCTMAQSDVLDPNLLAVEQQKEYGISLTIADQPMSGDVAFSDSCRSLQNELWDLLQDDIRMANVRYVGAHSFDLGNGKHRHCVIFHATEAVAQKVAGHYPDKEIITEAGEHIHAPAAGTTQLSAPQHGGTLAARSTSQQK